MLQDQHLGVDWYQPILRSPEIRYVTRWKRCHIGYAFKYRRGIPGETILGGPIGTPT